MMWRPPLGGLIRWVAVAQVERHQFPTRHYDALLNEVLTVLRRQSSSRCSVVGIGECRIDWGPGYRVYLAKDGESLIILFGGGTKKRQEADIARALALHVEYKSRKAQAARRETTARKKR